jgi:hypothetical protein
MQFQVEGSCESPMALDDVMETADTIRRGDIVWFERTGLHKITMRVVPQDQLSDFPHSLWQINRGTDPDVLRLTLIRGEIAK